MTMGTMMLRRADGVVLTRWRATEIVRKSYRSGVDFGGRSDSLVVQAF